MIRRVVICLLITIVLLSIDLAEAQQPAKVFKIGWLASSPDRIRQFESHKNALRALGYILSTVNGAESRFISHQPLSSNSKDDSAKFFLYLPVLDILLLTNSKIGV